MRVPVTDGRAAVDVGARVRRGVEASRSSIRAATSPSTPADCSLRSWSPAHTSKTVTAQSLAINHLREQVEANSPGRPHLPARHLSAQLAALIGVPSSQALFAQRFPGSPVSKLVTGPNAPHLPLEPRRKTLSSKTMFRTPELNFFSEEPP